MSMGDFLKDDTGNAADNVDFRFKPKRGAIKLDDIYCELFEWGTGGEMYAIILRIPDEFPNGNVEAVDIYDPYDAAKICSEWDRLTLVDQYGHVIVGDKNELLRLWGYNP